MSARVPVPAGTHGGAMRGTDEAFVIAVKREKRTEVPPDWVEIVRGTSGVTIVGEANPVRLHVEASPEAIERVRSRLSEYVHIEKIVPRARF